MKQLFSNPFIESFAHRFENIYQSVGFLLPEAALLAGIVLLLLLAISTRKAYGLRLAFWAVAIMMASLFAQLFFLVGQLRSLPDEAPLYLMADTLCVFHPLQIQARIALNLGALLFGVVFLFELLGHYRKESVEWLFWALSALLGLDLLLLSAHFLTFYMSFELSSIATYFLLSVGRQRRQHEALMKYVLFGAFASALMLYGISWIYGLAGSIEFTQAAFWQHLQAAPSLWLYIAWALFAAGVFFKLSVVPFHFWAPDAYEGAPAMSLAFVSAIPKVAILAFMMLLNSRMAAFAALQTVWGQLLMAVALASLLLGNFIALRQHNLKRLLAYSTIAHMGTLLLPVVAAGYEGAEEVFLYYWAVYALTLFVAFALAAQQQIDQIADLRRFNHTTGAKLAWGVVAFSLAGLPPTAGFLAKLGVFVHFWKMAASHNLALLLWVTALLSTAVALAYYIKIPYALFFKQESEAGAPAGADAALLPAMMIALLLVLAILWGYPFA
ncbi:NADH-quinone oxidoreductase subunit N [Thermonema rossianum]|uniref:NADH-quinone oxidoreductase subunit N n=1 Tax=Thermonema rossianum TaxID=55505 RepID=UPI00068B5365|nr:proton-conducting transporter membrane subunit [Thermonema rossianum]